MLQNATFLLLANTVPLFGAIGMCAGGLVLGFIITYVFIKVIRDKKVGSTEKYIAELKQNAENECKTLKKEAIVEVKEQELKLRNELERETREKRAELQRVEQRLNQKDEILNKKDATLLKRTEEVENLSKNLEK